MKEKRRLFSILAVLGAALLFLGGIFGFWTWANQPVSQSETPQIFVIKKGEDLSSISLRLQKEGLVKSSLVFKLLVLSEGLAGEVQAGDFRLEPSLTTKEVAYILTHGTLDLWLTFPEGWRKEEYARRLSANLEEFDSEEFLKLTEDKEGYLFPDTYLFPKEASASAVVKILNSNFEKKFNESLQETAKKNGLTLKQAIIMASILEREAGKDEDRPLIAGILLKRWGQDWPLQADATIQYITGTDRCRDGEVNCDFWRPVKRADLEIDSPYNTYLYKGLPPTPICNPGLASIRAVVEPQENDYWFYLSDSTGQIHYAKTNEEHNQNISRYLR